MIEQGSDEWKALRCGKVTASRVADILRKGKTGGVSMSRQSYLGELVAERLTGVPHVGYKSADMEWGNATEEQARDCYAFLRDAEMEAVAFVDHPKIAKSGASPDRLVGADGLLEVKCPKTHTHLDTLLGGAIDPDYLTQMHWQMACTGRLWCDFISFDPRLPDSMRLHVTRVHRNAARIAELEREVAIFQNEVEAMVRKLRERFDAQEAA